MMWCALCLVVGGAIQVPRLQYSCRLSTWLLLNDDGNGNDDDDDDDDSGGSRHFVGGGHEAPKAPRLSAEGVRIEGRVLGGGIPLPTGGEAYAPSP